MADEEASLESGYGPATPSGDNLVNDFQQETAASYLELARARGDRLDDSGASLALTDASTPLPFWNRAVLREPITEAEPTATTIRSFYGARGEGPYLFDSAWPTPDFRAYGCILMGHPPLMLRAADAPLPAPPPELRIVEIRGSANAEAFERTLVDGYPAPQFQPFAGVRLFTPNTFAAKGWHHFVGFVGDRPVAAGSSYVGEQLVRVENIATLDDVRGRGYGAAITAATIAADVSKPATLVASDLGRPVYEKLGFRAVARVTYWLGMR
jgi:Acetyltransferase (GNAT) domain